MFHRIRVFGLRRAQVRVVLVALALGGAGLHFGAKPATADVPIRMQPLVAPSGLYWSDVGCNQMTLHWKDNSLNEDGYRIYRRDYGASAWQLVRVRPANTTSAEVFNPNGFDDRFHEWKVVACRDSAQAAGPIVLQEFPCID